MMKTEKGLSCHHVLIMYMHHRTEEAGRGKEEKIQSRKRGEREKKRRVKIWEEVKRGGCGRR